MKKPLSILSKIGCFILLITSLVSCMSRVQGHSVYFNIELNKVRLNGVEVKGIENSMAFKDDNISISFERDLSSVSFYLLNLSSQSIVVDWNKCSIVGPAGDVESVIHKGVKLVDKNNVLTNSNIPPNSVLSDFIMPKDAPYLPSINIGWKYRYMYMWTYTTKENADEAQSRLEGKPTRIVMSLERGSETLEYDFEFILVSPVYGDNVSVPNIGKSN